MWISGIQIKNVKSFSETCAIPLARGINLVVGPNFSGKSTVLRSLNMLQDTDSLGESDIRRGNGFCEIRVYLDGVEEDLTLGAGRHEYVGTRIPARYIRITKSSDYLGTTIAAMTSMSGADMPPPLCTKPGSFIYAYLAARTLQPNDRHDIVYVVPIRTSEHTVLATKIACLQDPENPLHAEFTRSCADVLGLQVSTFPEYNQQAAGLPVKDSEHIRLEGMGDGVMHILNLLVGLCGAHNKLFLLEGIENDLYPRALKSLLRIIVEKSRDNQFVISTHSSIVLKYLGGVPESKIHSVSMEFQNQLPTSSIRELPRNPIDRRADLVDLGYELDDFSLVKG